MNKNVYALSSTVQRLLQFKLGLLIGTAFQLQTTRNFSRGSVPYFYILGTFDLFFCGGEMAKPDKPFKQTYTWFKQSVDQTLSHVQPANLETKSLTFQQQIHFDRLPDSPQLVYRLATSVPANWTPLLPVRKKGLDLADPLEIQLERAGMKRKFQYARSCEGKAWLWIGRSKLAGRGEAKSNLRFDVVEKTSAMR